MAELTVRVPSGNDGVVPQQPLVENLLLPELLQEKRATKLPYSLQGTLRNFLRKALSPNQRPSSSSMRNTRTIVNSGNLEPAHIPHTLGLLRRARLTITRVPPWFNVGLWTDAVQRWKPKLIDIFCNPAQSAPKITNVHLHLSTCRNVSEQSYENSSPWRMP